MKGLIGGLTPQEYTNLLSTPYYGRKEKGQLDKKKPLPHSFLSSFPSITTVAHRIFFFITHGFREFPTNAKLFQKFKSHSFSAIKTPEEYQTVKNLFTQFRLLNQFSAVELNLIHRQLKKIKETFHSQVKSSPESLQVSTYGVIPINPASPVIEEKTLDEKQIREQHEAQPFPELKLDIQVSMLPAPKTI
jgi:hypothetical protein